jgi:hypothetical protein
MTMNSTSGPGNAQIGKVASQYQLVPFCGVRTPRNVPLNAGYNLRGGGMDFGAVVKAGVPVAPALRREVDEVPDGSE